jgi:hypothetical protein
MRQVFLQILKDVQLKLKKEGVKSQIRLAVQKRRLSSLQKKILTITGSSTTEGVSDDWTFGVAGFWGTCLFVDVGLIFRVWCWSVDDEEINRLNHLEYRGISKNAYSVSIYQIDKVNNFRQKSDHQILVSSWSASDIVNPNWDPNVVVQKVFDVIMKGKEFIDFCKETGEGYHQYRPVKRISSIYQ